MGNTLKTRNAAQEQQRRGLTHFPVVDFLLVG